MVVPLARIPPSIESLAPGEVVPIPIAPAPKGVEAAVDRVSKGILVVEVAIDQALIEGNGIVVVESMGCSIVEALNERVFPYIVKVEVAATCGVIIPERSVEVEVKREEVATDNPTDVEVDIPNPPAALNTERILSEESRILK